MTGVYKGDALRGYCASKKEYFFGLKVCLIVTEAGTPLEFVLVPGATADITALRCMDLNLPEQSTLLGDGGFLDREFEAALSEEASLRLAVPRRSNMKEQRSNWTVAWSSSAACGASAWRRPSVN